MMRFIFESDIPSWSNPDVLKARLDRWVSAGLNAVILQVDDGHGATWQTDAWGADPRVSPRAIKDAVDTIHRRGLTVVGCVSLAVFNDFYSHYPALKLGDYQFPYYSFWNQEFRDRRVKMLSDLSQFCDLDALALDYLRTGREAKGEEPLAETVLHDWMGQVRSTISPGVPLLSVHHSSYASGVKEGVNLIAWSDFDLIDGAVLFNYSSIFPASHLKGLQAATSTDVWALLGNYDWINNQAVIRSGVDVARTWRRAQREISPDGIGIYLANLLTEDQAFAIGNTQRMVKGL